MEGENPLMGGNVDQNVQTPREHFYDRALQEKESEAEYQSKNEQTVARIIKRPYKAEMLRTIRTRQ